MHYQAYKVFSVHLYIQQEFSLNVSEMPAQLRIQGRRNAALFSVLLYRSIPCDLYTAIFRQAMQAEIHTPADFAAEISVIPETKNPL